MIGQCFGSNSGAIWALVGAFAFGIIYALIVYIPLRGKHDGYTSLLVVFGVIATLAFSALLIGLVPTLWVVAAFCCTGGPMIAGEAIATKIEEFEHRRNMADKIEEVTHADEAATVADCGKSSER